MRSKKERLLIVSTTGLGDTLWATPALKALKTREPSIFLAVLTSPVGATVLKDNPHIDKLFVLKGFSLFFRLKKEGFDTIYLFHASQRIILPLCYLLFPSHFIGTQGLNKGLDSLLTEARPPCYEHEILRRLALIGMKDAPTDMDFFFSPSDKTSLPPNSYILHVGAKDRFKQWAPNYFIALGNRLIEEKKGSIFISGSQEEKPLLNSIATHIPGAQVLILPLPLFAQTLTLCHYFITNDTGPMHLAFALKVPTLALFGPTDPNLCGPLNIAEAKIIKVPSTCTPCLKQKCRLPFCLEQISLSQVMSALI